MRTGQIAVGLIFLFSSLSKARGQSQFRAAVRSYGLIKSGRSIGAVAITVTVLELLVATAILGGWLLPWAILCATSLLLGFSAIVAIALATGRRDAKCGCMNLGKSATIGWYICFRNLAMVCLLLPGISSIRWQWSALAAAAFLIASFLTLDARKTRALSARSRRTPEAITQ